MSHLKKSLILITVLVMVGLLLAGCGSSEPILIGFAGELSGERADLGVAGRDGAQLAVDTINQQGGINGRPLKLIVKNDQGNPDTARQVDAELVKEGVVAIIGHMTSGQTAAVWEQMNTAKVVLFSPTASSSQFTGKADYLFRVTATTDLQGKALARHIYTTRNVRQITGIYDLGNQAFSEVLWQTIQTEFETLGGKTGQVFTFTSGETDLAALITEVKATNPEAVVFVASAVDTALMVQYSRQQELEAALFSSAWAQTDELLEKGGQAVEGVEIGAVYNSKNPSPVYQDFAERFKARHKVEPTFPSAYGYESVLVLADALKRTNGQAAGLPEALAQVKDLPGIQGAISLDEFGDVQREVYVAVIKEGQYEVINALLPR
jgi:branched-chain amino acid transport system substrate-binding protein